MRGLCLPHAALLPDSWLVCLLLPVQLLHRLAAVRYCRSQAGGWCQLRAVWENRLLLHVISNRIAS